MTRVLGRSLGLLVCMHCHATVRGAGRVRALCPRCGAVVHDRKPQSLATTTALVVSAALLYVPANVLPVMYTTTVFDSDSDTIMSGVLSLLHNGWCSSRASSCPF
jgi:paraquat-inducible protein A